MKQKYYKRYYIVICLTLVIATVIAFEPVRNNKFVDYDDDEYVTENIYVKNGIRIASVIRAFTTPDAGNWHPLTWLSHMLDCELFGLNTFWHHLSNLLFHIANTLLLFLVLKKMTASIWPSGFVAAAFALHPLHVESVAWVAERKDLLSGFFWMLTIAAYISYAKQPRPLRYLPVVLFLCLGLMSKPMVVTLPFVLLLLDYWPLRRFQWKNNKEGLNHSQTKKPSYKKATPLRLLGEKMPLFALVAASAVITFIVQQSAGAMKPGERFSLAVRISNALVSYVSYISKMFFPIRLAVLYPHPGNSLRLWQPMVSAVLLVGITAVIIYLSRRRRYLLVGWLWYLGTSVPVIGLIQVGSQAMADRYTYLPSIGIFIIVSWAAADFFAGWRHRKKVLSITAGAVLAVLLILTRIQVGYWRNNFTLFGHALDVTKNNFIMHNNFGNALRDKGQFEKAITHFNEALRINPQYLKAFNNKGKAFLDMGKSDKAIAIFNEVLDDVEKPYEVLNDLGLAYAQKGELDVAVEYYNKALKLKPDYAKSMNNLGLALKKKGQLNEAIEQWKEALKIKPDYAKAYYNMGIAIAEQGKYDDAVRCFKEALRIKPDWPQAHYNLGGIYVRTGNLELALEHCTQALRLKPDYKTARISLAFTLFELGRIQQAIEQFYKILQLDPDNLEVLNHLARILATAQETKYRNPEDAVKFAQRACELTKYKQPDLLDTLAAAYAAAGEFKLAVKTAEEAINLAEAAGKKQTAENIHSRLELYKKSQPYRWKINPGD